MTLSLPSSSSSSCSPLPVTASYLSLSPGHNYNLSTASTSVSGQSSPSALFSPASSTPGTAYGDVTGIWSMAEGASSMSVLDARGKVRGGKGKARASSTSQATGSTVSASSDTSAQPSTRAVSPTRSPTPPPVPTLPAQYRHASQPSPQAEYFADLVIGTLKANESLHGMLRKLNLGGDDLDEIRGELGGVYDRWRVTKGLDAVHINQPPSDIDMSSMAPPHSSAAIDSSSTPISPKRTLSQADQSFFTPASHRPPSRRDLRGAATAMPLVYESAAAANQGAQLMASMQQDSPLAVHAASQHSRTRSLSSASMLARGLVLNPMLAVQPQMQSQGRWDSEDETTSPGNSLLQTPSTGQGSFPTTEAIAGFAQSFGLAQMNPMGGHWRSATDPTHGRAYVMHGQGQGTLPQPVWHPMPPLDVNGNSSPQPASTMHSARSSATADSPKHMPLQQYTPFTPQHSKAGQIQVGHVPFTPPTPIQSRVANYGMSMGGMMTGAYGEQSVPMYYTTSMMSGSVNGGNSSGTGEETEVYRPSGDGANRSG
ncbi:hypothetical protein BCR39DRAFT_181685 [Naematelia encephala]|uniref:Uncharacterized protein n=1 Tax=Naematelia encephala TaxID=71784 RepID=A0A1Y2B2K6_9TREE|nr:hypothetical protein BCR39DRAFT_181685 [Naematelia encephala]